MRQDSVHSKVMKNIENCRYLVKTFLIANLTFYKRMFL